MQAVNKTTKKVKSKKFGKKIMRATVPLVFVASFLFLVFSLIYSQPAAVGLEDVLSRQNEKVALPFDSFAKFVAVVFGLSFMAITYEGFKSYRGNTKNSFKVKTLAKVFDQPEAEREAAGNLRDENKNLLYLNEELDRDNAKLQNEKKDLEIDIHKFEEAIKNVGKSEELMRKSNDALRKGYEKLVQEKESLILDLNKKEWQLREVSSDRRGAKPNLKATPILKEVASTGETNNRRAVETLINEVDQMISKKVKPRKQKNSGVAKVRKTGAKKSKRRGK